MGLVNFNDEEFSITLTKDQMQKLKDICEFYHECAYEEESEDEISQKIIANETFARELSTEIAEYGIV